MVLPTDYVPGFICTLQTCSVKKWGYIHYLPSLPLNILFLCIFALLLLTHLFLSIKFKTPLLLITVLLGFSCEILGYVARILMHYDPFSRTYFLWYLITLTIGPCFFAAAVYLCLGRVVVVYGEGISRISARNYMVGFVGCDILSLVIQAVGGGIAASVPLTDQKNIDLGTHILVAGLSFQVASLFAFSLCSAEFLLRAHKRKSERNPQNASLYLSKRFHLFLLSLATATTTLFIRTVFRSVELSGGFQGHLANSEVQFMVLDGVMVIIACFCLTAMHPGIVFGDKWVVSKFSFRKRNTAVDGREAGGGSVETRNGRVDNLQKVGAEKVNVGGEVRDLES